MFAKKCPIYGQFRTSTGNFSFFWWYRNRYWEKLVPEKVLERVSEKFGTEKVLVLVSKIFGTGKVSVSVSFNITQDVPCPDPILIHTDPPAFLWHPLDLRSHQEIFNA